MATSHEITAYIEEGKFRPAGICSPEKPIEINVEDKETHVEVAAPILGKKDTCEGLTVRAYILPEGREAIDCLFCTPPCGDKEDIPIPFIPGLPAMSPDAPGISECIKQLRWRQVTETHEKWIEKKTNQFGQPGNWLESVTYEKPVDALIFTVEIPELCGITGLSLEFELSLCRSSFDLTERVGPVPDDNSLQRTYEKTWEVRFPAGPGDDCFIPGEAVYCYAHTGDGRQVLVAYSWYETQCLTSALIQGCGLVRDYEHQFAGWATIATGHECQLSHRNISDLKVWYTTATDIMLPARAGVDYEADENAGKIRPIHADKQGNIGALYGINRVFVRYKRVESVVEAGGPGVALPAEWIGHDLLHWLIIFKGNHCWLRCSDYVRYEIGDRVLILKGGIAKWKGGVVTNHRCRNAPRGNDYQEQETQSLSDGCVAYTLNKSNDIILPYLI